MDDSQYFYQIFKKLWISNGGIFYGNVKTTNINILDSKLIKSYFSKPLSESIRYINKFSLNLMSRNVMLTILAERKESLVTESNINNFVKNWLDKNNIDSNGIFIENGAGLSRITKISAKQLLDIMERIYNDPLMPEMISSFPIIGTDGTLKKRIHYSFERGNGHFKTGSLRDVNAIAGYFLNKNKDMKIFIFMMNDLKANQSEFLQRDLIDLSYLH
jgi:D-alanyl-D-alanine carboxypeptidase/D-alanyl-D-alanine-endopeptidase (penicillin-binding protein 4)